MWCEPCVAHWSQSMRELEQNMPANEIVVSVLGICYNHAKTLRRALDSVVCQQTSFAFELLVHDDASTDGSADVIREYAERYPAIVRPFLESENQYGKGRSVITEMSAQARGRYVALLETDDCWCDSSKLERQVHALDEHPECAFSVHDVLARRPGDSNPHAMFPPVPVDEGILGADGWLRRELYEGRWMFQISCMLTRRDYVDEYLKLAPTGFPSRFYLVGDQPMQLFFLSKGPAWYIARPMSCYTEDSGGFMSRLSRDPVFSVRVHQGYRAGLQAFDEYSEGRYTTYVQRAILRREFFEDLVLHHYAALFSPRYKPVLEEYGVAQRLKWNVLSGAKTMLRHRGTGSDDVASQHTSLV